jgi:hypothetical protein
MNLFTAQYYSACDTFSVIDPDIVLSTLILNTLSEFLNVKYEYLNERQASEVKILIFILDLFPVGIRG